MDAGQKALLLVAVADGREEAVRYLNGTNTGQLGRANDSHDAMYLVALLAQMVTAHLQHAQMHDGRWIERAASNDAHLAAHSLCCCLHNVDGTRDPLGSALMRKANKFID